MTRHYRAIGLMSGTSLDGIDAALIETDGEAILAKGASLCRSYDPEFRARLRSSLGATEPTAEISALEADLTDRHATAVKDLLALAGLTASDIDVVGFHGQTINHIPARQWTWQIGLGDRLAQAVGIDTVYDLRGADVQAGGEGAPLAPVYHRALARDLEFPLAVLNLGGVGNLTYLEGPDSEPVAFDTGPANALLDDWVGRNGTEAMDRDGAVSAVGTVDTDVLAALMDNAFFSAPYPKSLDRNAFDPSPVEALGLEDGAATLAAFTVESVGRGADMLPTRPGRVLVTGGGRRNPTLMRGLAERLGVPVDPVESVGWDGDVLEAQAFAFMAVRSLLGLPISFPQTTRAPRPMTGGRLVRVAG